MRRFRRYFALLFIVATLISALHEIIHDHHHEFGHDNDESCALYLYAHTPTMMNAEVNLPTLNTVFEPFLLHAPPYVLAITIPTHSRSPPLS
ncbi:MAG: hypothetical protein PHW18_04830 [Sulfuricurvum sp.]|uniref:hypothetical protein n=1 Tax=Sulfuricurvum sp. TaxID=2025608 RepID=UPI0026093208|nr:hypothetical protein [Sulfuricurvum sp.]MDD2828880.1 hypothetical protein [Sulfuricurvum sp.]MDD4948543.1 hypothetical protein [Sulfuricurvum sp.]